jgi:hypothetical protein
MPEQAQGDERFVRKGGHAKDVVHAATGNSVDLCA